MVSWRKAISKNHTFHFFNFVNNMENWTIYETYFKSILKYLTKFHNLDHKRRQSFLNLLNPICSSGFDTESTCFFLIHYSNFKNGRKTFLDTSSKDLFIWGETFKSGGTFNLSETLSILVLHEKMFHLS